MKSIKFIVGLMFTMLFLFLSGIEVEAHEMEVPCEGRFKSYMGMHRLNKESAQYKYLRDHTTDQDNLRVTSDGYYAVALGSYYGKLGDKFVVTFENGQKTKVVKVDSKADKHTVRGEGQCHYKDGSIVEPITSHYDVETATNPEKMRLLKTHGNAGMAYKQFAGKHKITSIKKVSGDAPAAPKPKKENNKVTGQSRSEKRTHTELNTSAVRLDPEREKVLSRFTFLEGKMILHLPKVEHDKIVFLDTEFMERRQLVQAAFIIFDRIDESENFFLTNSLNLYVNTHVSPAFETFTGIKAGFLGNHGVPYIEAHEILESFVEENKINSDNTLLVGHGVKQDLNVLTEFGCPLVAETYDTHTHARRLLKRECNLKLSDLLLDAGLVQETSHDAYQDTRNLIPVFSHLVWVENRREDEES